MSEWTRVAQPVRCKVELDKQLTVRRERGVLAQGDANANAIIAEVYLTDGQPYDLAGCTALLTFVRPDNLAHPPISAEISGNTATATLTDACYEVSGTYVATMQLRKGGEERTVLWLIGDVKGKDIDGIVDPDHEIISIEDLMATAAEAQKAAAAANTAAQRANAGAERAEKLQIDASGLAGDSNKLGGKPPEYYLPAVQLLDNCYFKRPINQRGGTEFTAGETVMYWLDRWQFGRCNASLVDTGLSFAWDGKNGSNGYFWQPISRTLKAGETYTACAKVDGQVLAYPFVVPSDSTTVFLGNGTLRLFKNSNRHWLTISNYTTTPMVVEWAAIYEGSYTADTLPPYVPRPYAVELAECMLYWQKLHRIMAYTKGNEQWLDVFVNFPPMRVTPTVIIKNAELNGTPIDVSGMIGYCDGSNRGISSVQDTKGQFGVSAFQRVYLDIELNANM